MVFVDWEVFLPRMLNGVPLSMAHGMMLLRAHEARVAGYPALATRATRVQPGATGSGVGRLREGMLGLLARSLGRRSRYEFPGGIE